MRTKVPKGGRNKRWLISAKWDVAKLECVVTVFDQKTRDSLIIIARGEYDNVTKKIRAELRAMGVNEGAINRSLVGVFENDDDR